MALKARTRERASYCSQCGAPVDPGAAACAACGEAFEGTVEAQRCPACGGLAEATAAACGHCGQALAASGPGEEAVAKLEAAIAAMEAVIAGERARLGELEARMERTRARLEAIQASTRDVEVKERVRLNVWLGQAEEERAAILRVAEGWAAVAEGLAALAAPPAGGEGGGGGTTAGPGGAPEASRAATLQAWWEAQRGIQRQLYELAGREAAPGAPTAGGAGGGGEGERRAAAEVLAEVKKILDELPAGLQKKLRKSGKLAELEALLAQGKG